MAKASTKTKKTKRQSVKLADFSLRRGEKLKGTIFAIERNRIWVDLEGKFVGFVPKQEVSEEEKVKIGEEVEVTVLEPSDDEGNLVLSMRPFNKEEVWEMLKQAYENNEIIEVEARQANRGGLIVCKESVCGFLPVSQLTLRHYPRVEGGDKEEILRRLMKFIGKKFKVRIINFDYDPTKLIFSERAAEEEKRLAKIKKLKVGQVLDVEITGIADFGLFVKFLDDLEGLIHISEVSWERVDDLKSQFEIGQKLRAKIVSIENGRVALSLKRLTKDPWLTKVKKFKPKMKLEGKVKQIAPFGVLVRVEEGIEGLVPLSLLPVKEGLDLKEVFPEGETKTFEIKEVDAENHRLILIYPPLLPEKVQKTKEKLKKAGLSSEIITQIIRRGKTLEELKKLSDKELAEVLGISEKSAQGLKKALKKIK
ncbi:S1 RNA-binding domain-containing protein [bacterium]|nr:S1 RNA-binding domain-containing protein [bacterium]